MCVFIRVGKKANTTSNEALTKNDVVTGRVPVLIQIQDHVILILLDPYCSIEQ